MPRKWWLMLCPLTQEPCARRILRRLELLHVPPPRRRADPRVAFPILMLPYSTAVVSSIYRSLTPRPAVPVRKTR